VGDKLEYFDFAFDLRGEGGYLGNHVLVLHLALVEDLDGHAHAGQVVPRLCLASAVHFTFAKPPLPIVLPNM
jgi:hypothetical protein